LGAWQKQAIRESFLRENGIFYQFAKVFSLKSFRYTVYACCYTPFSKQQLVTSLTGSAAEHVDLQGLQVVVTFLPFHRK